jgi:hypothetical protein
MCDEYSKTGDPAVGSTRLVRRPQTAQDWDDAADLFEEGASLAGMASRETHTEAAAQYAIQRMKSLAMFATGKAMAIRDRERIKSPNTQAEPRPGEQPKL